jgi:hypothetical protein
MAGLTAQVAEAMTEARLGHGGLSTDLLPPVSTAKQLAEFLRTTEQSLAQDRYLRRGVSWAATTASRSRTRLVTEIRQHHLLISQTLARLKVDLPDEPGLLGVPGVNKARSAANKRWRGA